MAARLRHIAISVSDIEKAATFFEQAFDIGIRALETLEPQAPGDARVSLGELRAHLPHELQLAVVVVEETRVHAGGLSRAGVGDRDQAILGIDARAQQQWQRYGLSPQLRLDPERHARSGRGGLDA